MHSPLLPYTQIKDFLSPDELDSLFQWVLDNEGRFRPATIQSGDTMIVDPDSRIALTCYEFDPLEAQLRQRFLDSLPIFMANIGAIGPEPSNVELQLAAHGDGAFYRPHTDISIGEVRKTRKPENDRVLSAVLYFHADPKGFSGGELRLFRLGARVDDERPDDFVELQPLQNSLVVFHSWVPHEVRPVHCLSRLFQNYRFAVNCWFRRPSGA